LRTLNGTVTVDQSINAAGAGNVLLDTGADNLAVLADIGTMAGHLSVRAENITIGSGVTVSTGAFGTVDIVATGALNMAMDAMVQAADGSLRLQGGGDVSLGVLSTNSSVSLISTDGALLDAGQNATNVSANELRLEVATAAGQNINALETSVAVLSARSSSLNVAEKDDLSVGDVAVDVQRVGLDATTTGISDVTQSDLEISGQLLLSAGGILMLNDGGADSDGIALRAGGDLLATAAELEINARVHSTGGHVSLRVTGDLRQNSDVWSDVGTVELRALNVRMSADAVVRTNGRNLRIDADVNLMLGIVDARSDADRVAGQLSGQATWGEASLNAVSGRITDANIGGDSVVDIYARSARYTAALGVGEPGNPIETELLTVSAAGGSGGIHIEDQSTVSVGTVGTVPIQSVGGDGTITTVSDAGPQTGVRKTDGQLKITSAQANTAIDGLPEFNVIDLFTSASLPNVLTGMFEQEVELSNPTGSTVDAIRVLIAGLPLGVEVRNAAGAVDGLPFVQYNYPLSTGQAVRLTIEYFVPEGRLVPMTLVMIPQAVDILPDPDPIGSIVTDGFLVSRTPLENRALVEWKSDVGRRYWVQYSDDAGVTWTTDLAPITGTGHSFVWLDSGPPNTVSDSRNLNSRIYRVVVEN